MAYLLTQVFTVSLPFGSTPSYSQFASWGGGWIESLRDSFSGIIQTIRQSVVFRPLFISDGTCGVSMLSSLIPFTGLSREAQRWSAAEQKMKDDELLNRWIGFVNEGV